MFRLFRKDENDISNRLRDEAEPNKLTWTSGDGDGPEAAEDLEDAAGAESTDQEVARDDSQAKLDLDAELAREAEEYGLTGDHPTAIYGPNGEDVVTVLDALADIDDQTAEDIADAYEAVPDPDRRLARSLVRRLQRDSAFKSELLAAESAVSDWLDSLALEDDTAETYSLVADAATDAVDALILEDELTDLDFSTLYGPWSEVMEEDDEADGEGEEAEAEPEPVATPAPKKGAKPKKGAAAAAKPAATPEPEADEDEGEYGPNTELVVQFLEKLAGLGTDRIAELVDAWREQPKEELRIAHRDLQAIADEDEKWREQLRKAQDEIFVWLTGGSTLKPRTHADQSPINPDKLHAAREVAGPAVADAIAALVMADILEPDDAETLYAPWADVIGEPELPEYEE
jgi:cell division septation protein DedD